MGEGKEQYIDINFGGLIGRKSEALTLPPEEVKQRAENALKLLRKLQERDSNETLTPKITKIEEEE